MVSLRCCGRSGVRCSVPVLHGDACWHIQHVWWWRAVGRRGGGAGRGVRRGAGVWSARAERQYSVPHDGVRTLARRAPGRAAGARRRRAPRPRAAQAAPTARRRRCAAAATGRRGRRAGSREAQAGGRDAGQVRHQERGAGLRVRENQLVDRRQDSIRGIAGSKEHRTEQAVRDRGAVGRRAGVAERRGGAGDRAQAAAARSQDPGGDGAAGRRVGRLRRLRWGRARLHPVARHVAVRLLVGRRRRRRRDRRLLRGGRLVNTSRGHTTAAPPARSVTRSHPQTRIVVKQS